MLTWVFLKASQVYLESSQNWEPLIQIQYNLSIFLKSLLIAILVVSSFSDTKPILIRNISVTCFYAHMQQVKLFQGEECLFSLLDMAKWPSKFHSQQNVPIPSNLTSIKYYQTFRFQPIWWLKNGTHHLYFTTFLEPSCCIHGLCRDLCKVLILAFL